MYRFIWYGCTNVTVLSRTHGLDLARSLWLGLAAVKKGGVTKACSLTLDSVGLFIYILPLPPSPHLQLL